MYKLALRLVKRARLLCACRAPFAVRLQDVVCGEIKVRMLLGCAKLGNIRRQAWAAPVATSGCSPAAACACRFCAFTSGSLCLETQQLPAAAHPCASAICLGCLSHQLPLPADPCASGICLGYLRHQPSICTPLCFIDLRSTGSTAAVGSCKILCVYQQACLGCQEAQQRSAPAGPAHLLLQVVLASNFQVDLGWLLTTCPDLIKADQFILCHGEPLNGTRQAHCSLGRGLAVRLLILLAESFKGSCQLAALVSCVPEAGINVGLGVVHGCLTLMQTTQW